MPGKKPVSRFLHGAKQEFIRYLPMWFVYFSAMGLLHAAFANFPAHGFDSLGLSRLAFIPTTAFPMAWFVGFFVLRIHHSQRLMKYRWFGYVALLVLAVCVPLAIAFFHVQHQLSHEQLADLFELAQFFWAGLFIAHALSTRGRHGLVMFFGVTFIYGLVLENSGIIMNFFFEPSFRYYLGPLPAPLCTMLGWCIVFYVTVAVVDQLTAWVPWFGKGIWRRALATTALALSMDAQLDPLASMSGVFWRWNELLAPHLLGVPVINYAAWFGAFLPFSYFVFAVRENPDWSKSRANYELFLRVPWSTVLGGTLCFGIMAFVEGGFDGPTFQILRAFIARLMPY